MAARKAAKASPPKPRAKAKPKGQTKELIAALVTDEPEKPKPEQDPKTGRFVAGNGGNGGRRKGSRNKLGEAFTDALLADFEKATEEGGPTQGEAVIARLRLEDPAAYVRTLAMIMPKQVDVRVSEFEEMSDDELDKRIRQLAAALSLEIGTGDAHERAPTAH